ncbi:NAD-dependent epimerase/dehydratase family protein [bacterium CPR1]|nr:NAD-dependent epimerase/dehydratase family protein [bacterium CPR1]
MRILVTGADGLIGSRTARALRARGHQVIRGVRRPGPGDVAIDFERDLEPEAWQQRLEGIEVVVNAVGVARGKAMALIHERAPCALFEACARAGVRKIVQLSALGADEQAETQFQLSKRSADDLLVSLPLQKIVIMPSLVIGRGGASTDLFAALASLPLIALPAGGQVRPIAVDDLVQGIVTLVEAEDAPTRVAAVGPVAMDVGELIALLAGWLRVPPPRILRSPALLTSLIAGLGDHFGNAPVTTEMLRMLRRGNTAPLEPWVTACGVAPRPLEQALEPSSPADLCYARLYFIRPLLRWSIAFIWLATALICAFFYPATESYALLSQCHVPAWLAPWALYGACALDAFFGLAMLLRWHQRPMLLMQVGLIALYSGAILWCLPDSLLHPFGPMTKNVPLIGAILALWAVEGR